MILDLLERGVWYICRSVLRFLDRSISRAMGCFFACFRVRDDRAYPRRHLLVSSRPVVNVEQKDMISKNRLSSLFESDGREEYPSFNSGVEDVSQGSPRLDKELRDEAMFLKACGTLPETPIEIRVATEKLKGQAPSNTDFEDLKFQSWQTDLKQLNRALERAPVASDHSPISCISSERTIERISISSDEGTESACPGTVAKNNHNQSESSISLATPLALTTNTKRREKLVRFECNLDTPCQNFGKLEPHLESNVSKRSPRPTPLKLGDDMQTPGTVFPATVDALAAGKDRIRSQYVYSAMNPIQNNSRWKAMKEETSNSDHLLREVTECGEQLENTTAQSEAEAKDSCFSIVDAGVPSFLVPPPSAYDTKQADDRLASKIFKFGSNDGDRPIIGMVAANWLDAKSSDISHKWWDGNGIPNSTTKYKEDQKVSWHATPFEERLEKALSEESIVPKSQKNLGRPIVFDCEESDSSLSHIQAFAHSKSVAPI